MLQKRCPWCGEVAKSDNKKLHWCRYIYTCSKCGNYYIDSILNHINFTLLIIFLFIVGAFKLAINEMFYAIILIILLLGIKSPLYKYKGFFLLPSILDKKDEIKVVFKWYRFKEGGLAFINIRIWNYYILSLDFVDEKNNSISKRCYVRIRGIKKRFAKETLASIQFINEDIDLTNIKKDQKFMLSNNKEIIALGKFL